MTSTAQQELQQLQPVKQDRFTAGFMGHNSSWLCQKAWPMRDGGYEQVKNSFRLVPEESTSKWCHDTREGERERERCVGVGGA